MYLKVDTAVDVLIGPFVDETNGKDAETGLTIEDEHVRLSKNGQNMIPKSDANDAAHDELGYHNCPLNGTDTNTLGMLDIAVHMSGALPVHHTFMVITANMFDTLFSTDMLQADLVQMGGVAQSGTDLKDFADAGYDPSTDKITGCKANDDMVAEAPDAAAVETACDTALGTYNGPTSGELDSAIGLVTAVVGDLADVAAVGEVTEADTLMQYMKQLLNVLIGTTGIGTWPNEQAPANGINLFEAIKAIHADVTGLNGDGMVGTDDAALATVLGSAVGADISADIAAIPTTMVGTDGAALAASYTATRAGYIDELAAANLPSDMTTNATAIAGVQTVVDALDDLSKASGDGDLAAILKDTGTDGVVVASINTDAIDAVSLDEDAVDEILDEAVAVPGQAAPPAAPTMRQILGYLYKNFRNRKAQTATLWSLFADNESTTDQKATVSDDGTTAIKQEIVSG